MIAYLKGELTFKSPTYVVVEVAGVGYHVKISLNTYTQIEKMERVKLLTHLHIKEDAHTLFGFAEAPERSLFQHLISVSGVGPATAQLMLSSLAPDELRHAILAEDLATLKKVKGIGAKSAQRIILDLKDKLLKDSGGEAGVLPLPQDNTIRQEALMALVSLGINRAQAQKALNRVLRSQPGIDRVEQLVTQALKELH